MPANLALASRLAISAKSGGGTTDDDIVNLIDSHCPDATDEDQEWLLASIKELIPMVRYSATEAQAWARAEAVCHAENSLPYA